MKMLVYVTRVSEYLEVMFLEKRINSLTVESLNCLKCTTQSFNDSFIVLWFFSFVQMHELSMKLALQKSQNAELRRQFDG